MLEIATEQECIEELKKDIPKGKVFGVSVIQRRLGIGYSRAFRLMEWACINGHADREDDTKISFR